MKSFITSKTVWISFAMLCVFMLLGFATFFETRPFAAALAYSMVGLNVYPLLAIIFHALTVLLDLSFANIISVSLVSALLVILFFINSAQKKSFFWLNIIFCALGRVSNIYFACASWNQLLLSVVELCVSVGFFFLCHKLISAIRHRGIQCLTSTEKILLLLFVSAVLCGVSKFSSPINFAQVVYALLILMASVSLKEKTILVAVVITISQIVSLGSLENISQYFIFAVLAMWITPFNKFLSASVICLTDSIFNLIIGSSQTGFIATIIAAVIFVCVPKKTIENIFNMFLDSSKSVAMSYYLSKKQEGIKNKLSQMSQMFKQMQVCYRDLIIQDNNEDAIAKVFATEIQSDICDSCINKLACAEYNLSASFEELIKKATESGKVTILDVPSLLSSNCTKLNSCLSLINQMSEQISSQTKKIKADQENKLNISLQLGGTSKIFSELGESFSQSEKINKVKSAKLKDLFTKNSIVCKECLVLETQTGVDEIIVLLRNVDCVNPEVLKCCEKMFVCKFERTVCFQTKIAGWSLLGLKRANKFEIVCGCATAPKEVGSPNGDNYVYTKLNSNKYLIAICDGMGHGQRANNLSTTAINLIENYYKCGMSSKIVLDSVNNILLPMGDSQFTTLDAAIVDVSTGEVDFIKMGSSVSIIKKKDQSKIVDVESLPLGVLEKPTPTFQKAILFSGDIIILVSDGIADTFSSKEEFCHFVNNENIINMQMFAQSILEEAMARNSQNKDDMTVMAIRLINQR